ncbi:MAG TPA: AI-2E family transporter [Solirubrobacteraceae bacterium]|nr:AI-2E family transporter [Solirubrobacteraceae bacterium]
MAGTGPSTKQVARIFLTVAGLAALLYVLYLVRSVVWLVAIAIFVAMALGPAVGLLNRARIPRALSIIIVYLAIAAAIVGIGTLLVPPLVSGVKSIANDAPTYIAKLRKNRTIRQYDNRYHITQKIQTEAANLPQQLGQSAGALSNVTVGVFSAVFQLITVLTIAFFLLLDGERMLNAGLRAFRPAHAVRLGTVASDIYRSVAGYVAGNLAISVIAGVVSLVTLLIIGVPFAVPLAVLMAFFDLIPLVGATIGAIVVGLVTLFTDFPTATIVWAIVQLIYQQIESSVLVPVVYRRTVNVSGLLTVVAVLMGAQLLGILGALVAIPVAGAIQIIAQEFWKLRAATDPPPAAPAA